MPGPPAALLLLLSTAAALRAPLEKPNVVMFFVDDLGYGDVGFNGHPTTRTPNFDNLAHRGKVLTSWYSGCPVCSGSRSALMTGRQFVRLGVPGVFGPTANDGLNLNETVVAKQLTKAGYKSAAVGKWHLGQREAYLPGSIGFDRYLGIPYSDDMGEARATPCPNEARSGAAAVSKDASWSEYLSSGHAKAAYNDAADPAANFLPLVYQENGNTSVLEQPLDFTTLSKKYRDFAVQAVTDFRDDPFFLYMPFSHVHTTAANQPFEQYASCAFKNSTRRGPFGDALADADWIAGEVVATLAKYNLTENTLILFTGDNGPWMVKGASAGSTGLFYGRSSGYWNVGKGSTWEGGIREAAFAYWPGQVTPGSRSAEVVSSLDLFPTVSALAGVPLPQGVVYDGRDATDIILDKNGGRSQHDFLFFYGGHSCAPNAPSAVRYGRYKAHFGTGPGLSGCTGCKSVCYDPLLLFDIEADPSEAYPLANSTRPSEYAQVISDIEAAYKREMETMHFGTLIPAPDGPGEGPGRYGVCCDRSKGCDCDGPPSDEV